MIFSRTIFFFFNDPEGPNLLVVTVMAMIIYFLSLGVMRLLKSSAIDIKRLFIIIFIQIIIATTFYLFL